MWSVANFKFVSVKNTLLIKRILNILEIIILLVVVYKNIVTKLIFSGYPSEILIKHEDSFVLRYFLLGLNFILIPYCILPFFLKKLNGTMFVGYLACAGAVIALCVYLKHRWISYDFIYIMKFINVGKLFFMSCLVQVT